MKFRVIDLEDTQQEPKATHPVGDRKDKTTNSSKISHSNQQSKSPDSSSVGKKDITESESIGGKRDKKPVAKRSQEDLQSSDSEKDEFIAISSMALPDNDTEGSGYDKEEREDAGNGQSSDDDEDQDYLSVPDYDYSELEESTGSQTEEDFDGEGDSDIDSLTPAEKYLAPDDSEEDDFPAGPVNTIGNIPIEWYDEFPHIGYDLEGKKVFKPATKDELDQFLEKMDDPKFWSTFRDKVQHKDATLTNEELEIIKKLQNYTAPDADYDPFPEFPDFFTQDVMKEPLSAAPEPKRRFIPSKWEHQRIMKIVRAIRAGVIVPGRPKHKEPPKFYNLWDDEKDKPRDPHPMHMPAPKLKLPDNSESVNPPEEYLLSPEELEKWERTDPEDRQRNYVPAKYPNLRSVPGYKQFVNERFSRCLDLYLCPRTWKKRPVDPETLMPQLPDPKELEPFPKRLAIVYRGHVGHVRSFSVDPTGQWMVSGGDDKTIRLWEVSTGRCLRSWSVDDVVLRVSWNPNKTIPIFASAVGDKLILINPAVGNEDQNNEVDEMLRAASQQEKSAESKTVIVWRKPSSEQYEQGYRAIIEHTQDVSFLAWHKKGDYFASLAPTAKQHAVQIHQLSKFQSQSPFSKANGIVQRVLFHPSKPFLFVATQRYVRVYNLIRQELHRCLQPGFKWISSIDIHPQGDNIIVGAYDKKACWIDMDLSVKPYKTLKYHDFAVRDVSYHRRHPLFATCSDDGQIHIFHGMVYHDLMQNPLIVPVKILKAHQRTAGLGALHCEFHPMQPWVFSSGSDGLIKLFT